jgi:predicted transcriptional regulator of viral defense system
VVRDQSYTKYIAAYSSLAPAALADQYLNCMHITVRVQNHNNVIYLNGYQIQHSIHTCYSFIIQSLIIVLSPIIRSRERDRESKRSESPNRGP